MSDDLVVSVLLEDEPVVVTVLDPTETTVSTVTAAGLPGAQGPPGPAGADSTVPGPQGPPGADGADGPAGADGADGPQGPPGDDGAAGADGAQGPIGLTGPEGPEGPQGDPGPTGSTGNTGPAGSDGTDGADGAIGPQGPQGDPGPTGADGEDAEVLIVSLTQVAYDALTPKDPDTLYLITDGADRTILTGTANPTASDGIDGDFWINTTAWTIFGPKAGTWPAGVSIVGPTGATGPTGPGSDGATTTQTGTVSTTGATPTTIVTVPIPASTTVLIEARVVSRRTGGSGVAEDGAGYIRDWTFKNVAGVPTIIGAVATLVTMESQSTQDVTAVVVGTNVEIRVTGVATTNINWKALVKTYEVS